MRGLSSCFVYSKSQQNGIFFLGVLVILLQLVIWFFPFDKSSSKSALMIDYGVQKKLDSLKELEIAKSKIFKTKPFNPNFISDYKGYMLGMSVAEIDKLQHFRETGQYIKTSKEFQEITQISDSLLSIISPYFNFPVFKSVKKKKVKPKKIVRKDINLAMENDLKKIKGIGNKRAATIVKYRKLLGGFTFAKQMTEVWGLPDEVVSEIWKYYKVKTKPEISKININEASVKELNKIVYIDYKLAQSIVGYRKEVAEIQNLYELKEIKDFPLEKFDLITLYLRAD